jgi:very-short-patch-repair endonuclease
MGKSLNPSQPPLVRGGEQAFPPDKGGSRGVKPFLPYNKTLTALARKNRKNPTPAETRMWHEVLRMRQLAQYKFLRQKPIGRFVVDFYCAELRLVIEIDGHDHAEKAGDDLERTRFLNGLGLRVIRYGNNEILGNIEGVYEDLVVRIQYTTPTPPSLPLSGEGQIGGAPTSSPLTRGDRGGLKNCENTPKDNPVP